MLFSVLYQTFDEWFANFNNTDLPIANERQKGDGSTTWRQNFTGFWSQWRDDVITRDWECLRKVNPNGYTLESWMRTKNYRGVLTMSLLKNMEEDKAVVPNRKRIAEILGQESGHAAEQI